LAGKESVHCDLRHTSETATDIFVPKPGRPHKPFVSRLDNNPVNLIHPTPFEAGGATACFHAMLPEKEDNNALARLLTRDAQSQNPEET
jgi:hypothetical protein